MLTVIQALGARSFPGIAACAEIDCDPKTPVKSMADARVDPEHPRMTNRRAKRLAEGVGFEPTVELPPRRFSRPLP